MTELTDILQYLDDDGLIDEANCKDPVHAVFLTGVIESASENYRLPITLADAECLGSHNNEVCLGEIETWIYAENNCIGWECVKCGETGAILNWEGTRWDMRDTTSH